MMMSIINASLAIILTLFTHSFGFDLKCEKPPAVTNMCFVVNSVVVTSPNETITSVNGNTDPDLSNTYDGLLIEGKTVKFLPNNIATFFPKLEKLQISISNLERIEQTNIRDLQRLRMISLYDNNLETLGKDLFDFNTQLEDIDIRQNRLRIIQKDIFYGLTKLRSIKLEDNPCTDSMFRGHDKYYFNDQPYNSRDTVVEALHNFCESWDDASSPERHDLTTEPYDVLEEPVTHCDMEKVNEEMKNLQIENAKLRHQFKSCDGNLDAALSNYRQQKMTSSGMVPVEKSNDSTVINLKCEVDKCVAIDFQVFYANLSMGSDFYNTTTVWNLEINQQQTHFLPQTLAKHFPRLWRLSVTESGLCEISYSVFEGLDLSTLVLTSNKISEIIVDTFTDLNNLRILDLSFNEIHSLNDDVFANTERLQRLYLNNNYLTSFKVDVVNNMRKLQILYLQGNRLKFISATLLTQFANLLLLDLSDNVCIDMNHPTSSLVDAETTIINACTAPVEFTCQADRNGTSGNVDKSIYCNVEDLTIEYPKTKISLLRNNNTEQGLNEYIKFFVADKQSIKFLPFQLSQQLPNLERIEIQQSNLTALHSMDFVGFSKLTEIVISRNNLSSIDDGTFDTIPQLELLDLSSNAISALPANAFVKLPRLHTLILSDNQIVRLTSDFVPPRNRIVVFRVDNNRLGFIRLDVMLFLSKANFIDLSGNVCIDKQYVNAGNRTHVQHFLEIYRGVVKNRHGSR